MEPKRYRKKPVEIEAMRWDTTEETLDAIQGWAGMWVDDDGYANEIFARAEYQWPFPPEDVTGVVWDFLHSTWVGVKSGQYIIQGVQGEYYPCDPGVFEATHESASDDE